MGRTSYLKALDVWLVTCFVFTFLVLLEYCAVLYLSRSTDWYEDFKKVGHGGGGSRTKKEGAKGNRGRHVAYLVPCDFAILLDRWDSLPKKKIIISSYFFANQIEKWSSVLLPAAFAAFCVYYTANYFEDMQGFGDDGERMVKKYKKEFGYDLYPIKVG